MAIAATSQEPRDALPSLKQGVTPADTKLTIRHGLFGSKVPIQVRRPAQTLGAASLTLQATSDVSSDLLHLLPLLALFSTDVLLTSACGAITKQLLLPTMLPAHAPNKHADCKEAQCEWSPAGGGSNVNVSQQARDAYARCHAEHVAAP